MNIETAQLVVPLLDFISKWSMFGCHDKSAALTYLKKEAGLEPHELAAVEDFLTALDDDPVEEDD